MPSRKLVVEVIGDSRSLEAAFKRSTGAAQRFDKRATGALKGVGKAAAITAGASGLGLLIVAVKRGFDEFAEGQKVTAQTNAVLKSTGGVAGVTAKQVERLAQQVSAYSGVDDEAVQATENLILGFKGIRNEAGKGRDVFDRLTKVVIDYSVRTGKDAKGAALLFSKALQEIAQRQIPKTIRGVGKLSDELQKEIAAHIKAGDVAGAQSVLLTRLEKSYGGAARAAGGTLTGSLNKLKNSFDNLAAIVVGAAAPALTNFADAAAKWLSDSKNQARVQRDVEKAVRLFSSAMEALVAVVRTVAPPIQAVVRALGGLKNVLILIFALKAASKLAGLIGPITMIGTAAQVSTAQTSALRLSLARLAGIGVITIGIEILLNRKAIDKAVTGFLNKRGLGAFTGDEIKTWSDWRKAPDWAKQKLLEAGVNPFLLPGAPKHRATRRTASAGTSGAGAVPAAGFATSAHERPIVIHHTTTLDGRKVEESTTRHQQTRRRRNPPQRRGRFAGGTI